MTQLDSAQLSLTQLSSAWFTVLAEDDDNWITYGLHHPTPSLIIGEAVLSRSPLTAAWVVWGRQGDDSAACEYFRTLPQTTPAIFEACGDLKVLGKKDFRMLLTWRLKAADAWKKHLKAAKRGEAEGSSCGRHVGPEYPHRCGCRRPAFHRDLCRSCCG